MALIDLRLFHIRVNYLFITRELFAFLFLISSSLSSSIKLTPGHSNITSASNGDDYSSDDRSIDDYDDVGDVHDDDVYNIAFRFLVLSSL